MALHIKVLATKPDGLSSVPKPDMGEGENRPRELSSDLNTRTVAITPPIHTHNKEIHI